MTAQQLGLPMPPPPKARADYEGQARRELGAALARAKAATSEPPWDRRQQDCWRIVAPQMSGWLPEAERQAFLAEFLPELDRIEALL